MLFFAFDFFLTSATIISLAVVIISILLVVIAVVIPVCSAGHVRVVEDYRLG